MRVYFIAAILPISILWNASFAQTVKWSQALQDNKKLPYMTILGSNEDDNFFILRSNISLDNDREHSGFRNRSYLLQCYSSEMALVWDKDLKTSYENGHITDVRMINDKVIVTSYISEKKSKYYYFFTQYLDGGGKWMGQPILLDSIYSDYIDDDHKPGLISSHDQSYIAFSYRKIDKEDKSQTLETTVLDTGLAITYKKEITIPVSSELYQPVDFILTNQASFFILGIHFTTEKKVKSPGQSYYEVSGYDRPMDSLVNAAIKSENKYLTDVKIIADNNNRSAVVAGFFSDKTTYSVAGVFYYSVTEDSLKVSKIISTPFSDAYLQKFLGERKENRELVNYSIDRIIVRKDGGVGMVAESVYETSRSYYDYFMQTYVSHVYYHYGNIMLLSLNPDGNILWSNVVNKDQNSVDDGGYFSSFYSAITDGRLVIIYNKYIEDDSSVLLTSVQPGGIQKTDVLVNQNERCYIIPKSARQIDEDTILIPSFKNNKFYILKVSF